MCIYVERCTKINREETDTSKLVGGTCTCMSIYICIDGYTHRQVHVCIYTGIYIDHTRFSWLLVWCSSAVCSIYIYSMEPSKELYVGRYRHISICMYTQYTYIYMYTDMDVYIYVYTYIQRYIYNTYV